MLRLFTVSIDHGGIARVRFSAILLAPALCVVLASSTSTVCSVLVLKQDTDTPDV